MWLIVEAYPWELPRGTQAGFASGLVRLLACIWKTLIDAVLGAEPHHAPTAPVILQFSVPQSAFGHVLRMTLRFLTSFLDAWIF